MARPELAWLAGFLRDWPGPLGPAEPPPWTASTALLRPDETEAELTERARGFLGRSLSLDDVDRAYFAVYDGHGGIEAANYAAAHLHVNVAHHEKLLENPAEALRDSFQKTDEMFLLRARREKLRSGTTGVSCFLVDDKLHIAWLGDSQVMLVQQGKVITLMEPHKPERE
ncbi:protein phosphatase 1F-like, partial [Notechis scutatus]|uniref:Protein phosphatase 1F-like n=1 Tax=Notechis scutatus TaxID=8663 RepID=A0A6J1VX91_9SAUR